MKIVYLANNLLGLKVLEWLKDRGEEIVGLVIHPPTRQKYAKEMKCLLKLPSSAVFDGSRLNDPKVQKAIRSLRPDLGISILFDYILRPAFLEIFPRGVINLHPSFLPYNRGQYPNVWSIVEGTPAGATLHYIDRGIDTGAIIAQKKVDIEPIDTGEMLYRKLERASMDLFKKSWPFFASGKLRGKKCAGAKGTYHCTADVEKIDRIELSKKYPARELIDILRARTFPPYRGAYFIHKGRRIYMRLELEPGEKI
jgi:methionyl-tRNA formyltransferase